MGWGRRSFFKKKTTDGVTAEKVAKFKNIKTEFNGRSFASKGEAECYAYLCILERAGERKVLGQQKHVKLSKAQILYIPDFLTEDLHTHEMIYCEFKGFETPEWKIKRRLWMAYGPAKLEIYKKIGGRVTLTETIIPKGDTNAD